MTSHAPAMRIGIRDLSIFAVCSPERVADTPMVAQSPPALVLHGQPEPVIDQLPTLDLRSLDDHDPAQIIQRAVALAVDHGPDGALVGAALPRGAGALLRCSAARRRSAA